MSPIQKTLCCFCGQAERLDVLELYDDGSILLDTCCEAMHEWAMESLPQLGRRELCDWFEASTGFRARQLIADSECPSWVVDPGLGFCHIDWPTAREFVNQHHRENSAPPGWKFGIGLRSGSELVAVMIAGRPLSRAYDHRKIVEITRVCVKDLFPRALGWNACSMLYGYACREARRRGFRCALTYTRLNEPGTSLIAAGFVCAGITKGGSWNRNRRPRPNAPAATRKCRWWRALGAGAAQLPHQTVLFR